MASLLAHVCDRRSESFEHRRRAGVDGLLYACVDRLHIDIARGTDAGMPKYALRVLESSMMLHVGTQRPPHHLEGDKAIGNTQLPSNGPYPPFQEVLPPTWNRLPLAFPTTKGGEHQSRR